MGTETYEFEVPGTRIWTSTVFEHCFSSQRPSSVRAVPMGPSPRLVLLKQSPRPVSKAVLHRVESPECESYHSAFSAFMTTQLSRDTSNLECCSKRTLFAMEWQHQCSMDLHRQIGALLINSSAALFALSGYFSHLPYPYQPVCFSVRYTS